MSDGSADLSRRRFLRTAAGGGAAATAAAATAGTAAAQEGEGGGGASEKPVFPSYVDGAKGGAYEDRRGQSEVTVEVGADPQALAFAPTKVWVDPGTTITFEWVSDGHNVKVNNQPASDMAGSPGGETNLFDTGYSYTETLETGGMYTYYCQPHEPLGMVGAVAVGPDVETESTGGGGGGGRPSVPDSAKSLGIAAGFAGASTLALAYFFIKYGGNYSDRDTEEVA